MTTQRLRQRIGECHRERRRLRADQAERPCPIRALFICDLDREIEQLCDEFEQRIQRQLSTPRRWEDVELSRTRMGIRARQSVTRRWLNRRRRLSDAEIAFLRSANSRTLRYRNHGIEWETTA